MRVAGRLVLLLLGGCSCGFDAGKLDALACSSETECGSDQDCIGGTCVQRRCRDATECGQLGRFECQAGFCEAVGCGDSGACPEGFFCDGTTCLPESADGGGDADADADADADGDSDADGDGDAGTGVDAGSSFDAGSDAGSTDAGSDAGSSCDDVFGAVDEYILCSETAETCTFHVRTGGPSCANVCAQFGAQCAEAFDDEPGATCVSTGNLGCNHDGSMDFICACTWPRR